MKKFLLTLACGLLMAAAVTGCSKKAANDATPTDAETTASTSDPTSMMDLSAIDNGTVTLGDYKGVEVTKDVVEVIDEEVDAQIQSTLDANPDYVEVNREAKDTDQVNIDYVGTKDGVAFDGGTAEGTDLVLGSNSFIPGFESGLVGAKKGEEKTLNITFPENYQSPDLAGQAVEFKVKVNAVKEKTAAVLSDEFVQRVTQSKTVDEYKESVKQNLLSQKESQAEQKVQSDLLSTIVSACKVETKQDAVDANYNNYIVNYTNQATMYGVDLNTYTTNMFGMDENGFKDEIKRMSQAAVEQRLVFNAIAEKENITVSDEDRENVAKEMGYESKDKMIETVGQYMVDDYIISTKTMDFLVENAVIK